MFGAGLSLREIIPGTGDNLLGSLVAGLLERLEEAEGLTGYAWIALGTLAGGVGVPIPEEAVLGVAGWLASTGRMSLVGAYVAGWTCIVAWDVVLHGVGRRLGPRIETSWIGRRLGPERLASARRFFDRHGMLAVGIARFVMGSRLAIFLLAGASGMSRRRFLSVVAPLALVSVAIPLALGYWLGPEAQRWIAGVRAAQIGLLAMGLVVVLALLVIRSRRRARAINPVGEPSPEGTRPSGPPPPGPPPRPDRP